MVLYIHKRHNRDWYSVWKFEFCANKIIKWLNILFDFDFTFKIISKKSWQILN